MSTNSFPEEATINNHPTEVVPKSVPPMEDLSPKQVSAPTMSVIDAETIADSAEDRDEESRTIRIAISKLNDFLQWFEVVFQITLVIRFCLKLIGANPHNLFAGVLYASTDILLFPFAGIVGASNPNGDGPFHFEWATLIAMIIYWLLFWTVRRFLVVLISDPEEPPS